MFLQQKPIPGYWYSNALGELWQVRALRYDKGIRSLIVIQSIKDEVLYFTPETWNELDMVLHSPVVAESA